MQDNNESSNHIADADAGSRSPRKRRSSHGSRRSSRGGSRRSSRVPKDNGKGDDHPPVIPDAEGVAENTTTDGSPKSRRSSSHRSSGGGGSSRRSSHRAPALADTSESSSNKDEDNPEAVTAADDNGQERAHRSGRKRNTETSSPSGTPSPSRTITRSSGGGGGSHSPHRTSRRESASSVSRSRRSSVGSSSRRRSSVGTSSRRSSHSASRRSSLSRSHRRETISTPTTPGSGGSRSRRRSVNAQRRASTSAVDNPRRSLSTSGRERSRRTLERPHTTTGASRRQVGSITAELPAPPLISPTEDANVAMGEVLVAKVDEEDEEDGTTIEEEPKKDRRKLKLFILFILMILIGIVIFILLRRESIAKNNVRSIGNGKDNGTDGGPDGGNKATPPPTAAVITPSPSVTPVLQLYDLSLDDCEKVKLGQKVDGQDDMEFDVFDLAFDVTIQNEAIPPEAWVPAFQESIDTVLTPALMGCPPIFDYPNSRRALQESTGIESQVRHVIASGNSTILQEQISDRCEVQETGCSRVNVQLQVYLKGDERGFQILSLIMQVISYMDELEQDSKQRRLLENIFELDQSVFLRCIFRGVERIDPTMAPSVSPTGMPSGMPTSSPSESPSQVPSNTPTDSPTKKPTPGPTPPPTPGPTPPPTRPPTPPPTRPPTPRPTQRPTPPPTRPPTRPPTPGPTRPPTPGPTAQPTPSPTVCTDDFTFVDGDGDSCAWYTTFEIPSCPTYGTLSGPCQSNPSGTCTANEACCICQEPLPPPTEDPTSGPTMGPTVCEDDATFTDLAYGDGCDWYNVNEEPGCPTFGYDSGTCQDSNGLRRCNAIQACCICREAPVNPPSPTTCQDDMTFADSVGDNCDWYNQYEEPGCPMYGREQGPCSSNPTGTCTATEACCICQEDPVQNPSTCQDDATFTDSYGDGCDWYTANESPGCPTFGTESGPCDSLGTCTAIDACCVCQEQASTCEDDRTFADGAGDGCDWYNTFEQPGCPTYGQLSGPCDSLGTCTATDACCICQEPPLPTEAPTSGPTVGGCQDEPFQDLYGDSCSWYVDNDDYGCSNFGYLLGICTNSPTGFCTAGEACCHCNQDTPPLQVCADNPTFRDSYLDSCDWFSANDPDCTSYPNFSGTCAVLTQSYDCDAMSACCQCNTDPNCVDDPTFIDDNGDCVWYYNNDAFGCPNFGGMYTGTCFDTVPCTTGDSCCHCQ